LETKQEQGPTQKKKKEFKTHVLKRVLTMTSKAYRYMMYNMHVPVKVYSDGTFDTFGELMSTSYQLLDTLPVAAKPLEKIDVTSWFPKGEEGEEGKQEHDSQDDLQHDFQDDCQDDFQDDFQDDSQNDLRTTGKEEEEEEEQQEKEKEKEEEPLYISVAELESAIRRKPGSSSLNQTLRWRPVARLSRQNNSRKCR